MNKVIAITEELVKPILEEESLELVDIEFVKESGNWFLRVYIDKPGGVDIEDCGRVSEKLGKKLDEKDPISQPYFLEVSSPGAERPLKKENDFKRAVGKRVHIETVEPIEGSQVIEGELTLFAGGKLEVKDGTKTYDIPYDKVAAARLALSF